jgi:hypothetical protein
MKKTILIFVLLIAAKFAFADCSDTPSVETIKGNLGSSDNDQVVIVNKLNCNDVPSSVSSTIEIMLHNEKTLLHFVSKSFRYQNNYQISAEIRRGSLFVDEYMNDGADHASTITEYQFKFKNSKVRLIGLKESVSDFSDADVEKYAVVDYNFLTGDYRVSKKGYDKFHVTKNFITSGRGQSIGVVFEEVDFFESSSLLKNHVPSLLIKDIDYF